jgi:hypothetical protein
MSDLLSILDQVHAAGLMSAEEKETYYRLRDLKVDRVDLVRQGANGRPRFAVVKGTDDMSTQPDLDPGLGPEVEPDGNGGFVEPSPLEKAISLPGPVKDGMERRLVALLNMVRGAASAPPNTPIPAEISREVKAIAAMIGGSAATPSPKTASSGGKEKPMSKEAEPAVVELDGTTYNLTEIAKAGAKLNAANRKRLDSALKEIQAVIREETDPAYAALAKEARENTERLERIETMLAKAFGADKDKPAATPEAAPAAEPEQAPVAKEATPAPEPAAQPAVVAGSQAAPAAPAQPVAKEDDDTNDTSYFLGDINADDDEGDL